MMAVDRGTLRQLALERGIALGVVVLGVYLWLAPAHIVAGDNAEFATLGAVGGRAHPSGYPLYVLWLRATSWIPGASAAHAASLATAVLAGIQIVVLHAACRVWGARALAASVTCAVFAAAPLVLRVHTEADVFALNSLIASGVLWLAAPGSPVRGGRRAALLGLVAGLGLANNLTCVLLAPIGVYGVVRGAREASRPVVAIGASLGALVIGLVPYVYLPLAPDAASWAPVTSFGDLVDTILRKDYGTLTHVPSGRDIPAATSLGRHAALIGRIWLWVPAVIGLLAILRGAVRGSDRWAWATLGTSWLLAGPLFATRLHVEADGVGAYIGGRMQILSAVVLAIGVATALDWIATRMSRVRLPFASALPIAGFLALVALALPKLVRVHGPAVERGISNLLTSMPDRGIAIVVSEDQCFGGRYLQLVEGRRPDVSVVCWTLTTRDWYRARLAATGVHIEPHRGGPATAAQIEALLATGRPLLVDAAQTVARSQFPSYPHGVLSRIVSRGADPPPLEDIVATNHALLAGYRLGHEQPHRDDDFAAIAHQRYANTWRQLAAALQRAGNVAGANQAAAIAEALGPLP